MRLGKHIRTERGTFRKERGDALIGTLSKEYPVLRSINPRMKLETLRSRLEVESLNQVVKKLNS